MSRNKVSIDFKRSEPSQPHLDQQKDTDTVFNYLFLYVQDGHVCHVIQERFIFQVYLVAW